MELGALTMLEGFVAEWVHFTLGDNPRCTLFFFWVGGLMNSATERGEAVDAVHIELAAKP